MINIGILSEEKIITLKSNADIVINKIKENTSNEWLKDFFQDASPFQKSKLNVEISDLLLNSEVEEGDKYDLENAIRLHKCLQITDSQASDERLWISLCFGHFYNYMKRRWDCTIYNLNTHYFFPHGSKRSLYYNGVSKLYWFAKMTYDDRLSDPYELTKFCASNMTIISHMIYRGYANNKTIRLGIIKGFKKYIDNGGIFEGKMVDETLKYVSFVGGAYILDLFTEEEVSLKVYNKLLSYSRVKKEDKNFVLDN